MKKYLLLLIAMLTISVSSFAQIQTYRTTAFAQAKVYNGRYVWGDWENSNMTIAINLSTDVITIYSPITQIYRVYAMYNNGNAYYDSDGGRNVKFYVIDQDGDKGEIRLRIEKNGNSQLYVDFKNVAWVYNLVRTS